MAVAMPCIFAQGCIRKLATAAACSPRGEQENKYSLLDYAFYEF